MPMHPVTATLMYRGIYTIPDILTNRDPIDIPEDELEGECDVFLSFHIFALLPERAVR